MTAAMVLEPDVQVRALTADQVAELVGRLQAAIVKADALKVLHVSYAAEANAYRQVLATLSDL